MEEEIIERTVQIAPGSFILTIPQAIARGAGILKGQGIRFRVWDGEVVISPTVIPSDGVSDSAGPDKYATAIGDGGKEHAQKGPMPGARRLGEASRKGSRSNDRGLTPVS